MALSYKQVRAQALALGKRWTIERPVFHLRTAWTVSYDSLFEERFDEERAERELLAFALASGRALLSGRGGSGKTQLLRRLYATALESDTLPVYIDLKRWSGSDYAQWATWTSDDPRNGADFLLRTFGSLELGALELDFLPPEVRKLVIVDGLNEMNASVGEQILVVLDDIVRNQMNTSVIVADRLIRRDLPNASRWRIGMTLPLSDSEVRKHLGRDALLSAHDILTSPFFLNAQLKDRGGPRASGRAAALADWLRLHSSLTNDEIRAAASAAFKMYVEEECRSRVFPANSFRASAGSATSAKLEQSGVLVAKDGSAYFDHHIVHDFLASRHLAELDPQEWVPSTFRALSFEGASFDAFELTLGQLATERAELFLRAIYDWNLYAAGYVLGHVVDAVQVVGRDMRTVICAMLAEKRFDAILATRRRAADALRLIPTPEAFTFRRVASISEICESLRDVVPSAAWFGDWRRLYCVSRADEFLPADLAAIRERDSIIGWTVANVARRFPSIQWAIPSLTDILDNEESATVRWRAAHVLGKLPTQAAAASLIKAIEHDPDIDVRFGAVRSLIEVSLATDAESRASLGDSIFDLASTIAEHEKLSGELRSCLLVDPEYAPPDWLEFVRKCVRSQFLAVERAASKDIWRGCLTEAEALYPDHSVANASLRS